MKGVQTRWWAVPLMAAAVILAAGSIVVAQEKISKDQAPAAAKARSDFMKSNSDQVKILTAVAKGEAPLDAKAVAAAEKLNANSSELLSHFPAGSGDDVLPKDRAKAVIWKEWSKFTGLADNFKKATGALVVAAKSGDVKEFNDKKTQVDQACGACHKPYRSDPPKK
jgi:cytochrome c556